MSRISEQIIRITVDGEEAKAEVIGELNRCEKCKRWTENFGGGNYGYCYLDYGSPRTTDASDYCCWWEKKKKRVTMDDLISRQAAIDELDVNAELLKRVLDNTDIVGAEREKYEWGLELIESSVSDMKELPSIQPERKKGKWVRMGKSSFASCECGFITDRHCLFNFCPNCGAKMYGKETEDGNNK